MNNSYFSDKIISLVSLPNSSGYYCSICSRLLVPFINDQEHLRCPNKTGDHDFDILSYDNAIFTYRSGEGFDKIYEVHINYGVSKTFITDHSKTSFNNLISLDFIVFSDLDYCDKDYMLEKVETYLLLS